MDIENPRIIASQSGDRWALIVTWVATFTPQEITGGFEFETWLTYWEWDDSDHDFILNTGVSRFRPSSVRLGFSHHANVPGDQLDTELGGEELRAQIFLRNHTTGSAPISRVTPILQISPG
jgi:hypothetical protein